MYEIFLIVHITTCLLLILTVLLQSGKGAGLNLFGGGGDTLFSAPSGSSFMRQFTTGLAITFGITSLFLTLFASRAEMRSVTSRVPPPRAEAPAQPDGGVQPVRPGEAVNQPAPTAPSPGQEKK